MATALQMRGAAAQGLRTTFGSVLLRPGRCQNVDRMIPPSTCMVAPVT